MAVANITVSFDELFLQMEGAAPEEAKATAVKTFFTGAQFTKPADLVGVTERDLVEGVDGVVWPKNARQKALARKTIEFAQDLDFELRAQRRQALHYWGYGLVVVIPILYFFLDIAWNYSWVSL